MPFAVTVGYTHNGNGYDARIVESSGENVFRVSADAGRILVVTFGRSTSTAVAAAQGSTKRS
jgi:hypothetical protein